jgi:hypothetical protein
MFIFFCVNLNYFNMVLELILWNEPFNFFLSDIVSAFAIWYLCSVSAIVLVFCLPFSFCNSVLRSISAIFFCILEQSYNFKKIFVQFLRYLFSFCNLVLCLSILLHYGFLFLLIMATERNDLLQSVSVRLDGKIYWYWSYVMRVFLMVKRCGDMLVELMWYPKIRRGMLLW